MEDFYQTLFLTFKLAFITTFILFFLAIPVAYFLAYKNFKFKSVLKAIVSLSLVLPPTVLGFYFLIIFDPSGTIGKFLQKLFDLKLVFTFEGLVVASIIYSFPFMVHPIQSGMESLPKIIIEASYTLGKSTFQTLIKVILPNIKPAVLTGIVLSFAHTIGEFGVVLMVGGSIPGKTKVVSISIYEEVKSLNYEEAHKYALILLLISFLVLAIVYTLNRRIKTV